MRRVVPLLVLFFCAWAFAQRQPDPGPNEPPPRSDQRARDKEAGESSSRDTRIDLSPPANDANSHPYSTTSPDDDADAADNSDVSEFHPWDPHKALKDNEVADYYYKEKNYKAALSRYKEALVYKPNDAAATFGMAQSLEKMNQPEEAREKYEQYLKILPNGPHAKEAEKALGKLKAASPAEVHQQDQAKR